jgi:hypothetical protein
MDRDFAHIYAFTGPGWQSFGSEQGAAAGKADAADRGPEATPVGASVSSDRRAQDRS